MRLSENQSYIKLEPKILFSILFRWVLFFVTFGVILFLVAYGEKLNVLDKPRVEGKPRSVCTMPRRENVGCEETNKLKIKFLNNFEH